MDWDLEELTERWQRRWWDAKLHHAERRDGRPTYFIHFAYPGISGYLHVGHMRGFTYTDVLARFARMTGHDVLFPAGFHASGIPAVAFAKEVERGEKTEYLRANGYDGAIEDLTDPAKVVAYFAHVYTHDYWKKFGFLIDDRRNCTTIDAGYQRFIQWQFRRLQALGYLIQKPHYAPYCPVAGPVAVDKSETDIKQGGSAEVMEFLALRFQLGQDASRTAGVDEPIILPCATLRPETVYGVTNIWIHPDHRYELVRVWQDGAVADDDESELWLVSQQGRRKLEWQMERAEATGTTIEGAALVGATATAPVTGAHVPVVAGTFVDPLIATGVVMSVPGHAPFDWAAYVDAGLHASLGDPPIIIHVDGQAAIPAQAAATKHGATSQADTDALAAATEEVYADEFNKGVLNAACGPYAGERVKAAKDRLRADFLAADHGRLIRQFSETVISRAGELVDIRRVPDQDFIHYADKDWTAKAKAHAQTMSVQPTRYHEDLPNVLDWFGDRACVRRGSWLGTEFPFKQGWIIEPISDSTFYPWYYLVSLYVHDGRLAPDELTDAFFDYIFNGKGAAATPLWDDIRADVLHWGPVDVNLGGKEHQTVHFPVYIMNQVALLDDAALWPRGIFVNWWVTQKAGAKISKSKGGAEPIPGAAKRYGVDPMRLYYCHVGSPHVDIEWDPDIVLTYRQHVQRIARVTDDMLATQGEPGPMDGWLAAAMAQHLLAARDAYARQDLRAAAGELVYAVPDTLRWYTRRGGASTDLLRQAVQDWARALCPILPHIAEEMHARAGGTGLCSASTFPDPPHADESALARERYIGRVLEDIQTVQRLAGEGHVRLVTAAPWKVDIARRAAALVGPDGRVAMPALMKQVMADATMRSRGKAAQQAAGKIAQEMAHADAATRSLIGQEADILREAAPFLAAMCNVPMAVADYDEASDHPKREVAMPLKPGIAVG